MPTTRLSSKGQIIIPKTIRKTRSWEPGQEFDVIETDDGVLLRPNQVFPPTTFDDVGLALNYDGPPVPVDQLGMEAIPLAVCQHLAHLKTFDQQFIERARGKGTCIVEQP